MFAGRRWMTSGESFEVPPVTGVGGCWPTEGARGVSGSGVKGGAGAAPTSVASIGADAMEVLGARGVDTGASGDLAAPEGGRGAFVRGAEAPDESGEEVTPVRAMSGAPACVGASEAGGFTDGRVWAGEVLDEEAVEGVVAGRVG